MASSVRVSRHPSLGAVDTRPLDVTLRGTMQLDHPDAVGAAYVSAASGLAAAGGATWAVSDELPDLIRIPASGAASSIVPGLPPRASKYDLESIISVPAANAAAGATLLAFGSGSKADRAVGLLQDVDPAGNAVGVLREGLVHQGHEGGSHTGVDVRRHLDGVLFQPDGFHGRFTAALSMILPQGWALDTRV